MSDDGGDCGGGDGDTGGGDTGDGDSGGGDSGCSGGGDYGGNDNGCNSSPDVSTSHDNTSHSHADDDHSSHADIHQNHSSTSHYLSTSENALGTDHHTSHHNERYSADDQVSAHCITENSNDDPNYDYHHQINLLNSNYTSIDVYDEQNDFTSSTANVGRRYHAQPVSSKQMRRPQNFSTNLSIAFGLFVMGLVVLIVFFKS